MRHWNCLPAIVLAAGIAMGQVTPDPALRKNRNSYSAVMEVLKSKRTPVTDEQLEELKKFPLEAIWTVMKSLGYNSYFVGLRPTRPEACLTGRALTMHYLPRRPDVDEAVRTLAKEGDWPEYYNVRAAEEAKPGDVLVVDLGGESSSGVFFGDYTGIAALGGRVYGVWTEKPAILPETGNDAGSKSDEVKSKPRGTVVKVGMADFNPAASGTSQ